MKKYRWNLKKFAANIIEPIVGMLIFLSLGVVWI